MVNGENGDTFLQKVAATFWKTTVWSDGSVAGKVGQPGKTASVELAAKDGRIQDILLLFGRSERAPMSGIVSFNARLSIPPARRPFLEKVELEGDFGIDAGSFAKSDTQQGVNSLSEGSLYVTKSDLLETLVPYCQAGLESQEFCLWVVAAPLTEEDATHALKRAVPDLDRYVADHTIEIVAARDWYLHDGTFDLTRVISGWNEKLARASDRGYTGVRVTGDTARLEKKDWKDFCEYEDSLNQAVANQRLAVLCTYPLAACGAAEILNVVRTHQFAVTKRRGGWVIETAGHKQAKAEIKRLNEELEQRVVERTSQLTLVNSELTKEILQRKRAEQALLRSEAYLAEAQRVSHTGSFGWSVSSGHIVWSDETFRILVCDPANQPTVEYILHRTHPEDRAFVQEMLDRAECGLSRLVCKQPGTGRSHGKAEQHVARRISDLMKWGPTSANASPARLLLLRTKAAKERLRPALAPGNVQKTMSAPVTVIVAYDLRFYEKLPKLAPHKVHEASHLKQASPASRCRFEPCEK